MEIYQNFHISVNILQYRSIYAYIFRSYMFSYIGRYKTITYIGQYKPTSLKSFQYYIYRSKFVKLLHISVNIHQYRPIYADIFRSYMFSYIGHYKTFTYIGQYKPTSLKLLKSYIYRSIYAYSGIYRSIYVRFQ